MNDCWLSWPLDRLHFGTGAGAVFGFPALYSTHTLLLASELCGCDSGCGCVHLGQVTQVVMSPVVGFGMSRFGGDTTNINPTS